MTAPAVRRADFARRAGTDWECLNALLARDLEVVVRRLNLGRRRVAWRTRDIGGLEEALPGGLEWLPADFGDAWFTPVSAQQLARSIRTPEQLRAQTLIEVRGQEARGWKWFMRKQGFEGSLQILSFDGYLETMRAAEQGLGVALAVFPMTSEWVSSGRLAVPLALRIPLQAKISLLYRDADAHDPLYTVLATSLRAEYAALPALPRVVIAKALIGRRLG